MPALFIGHGSPMNALELNGFTLAWRALGKQLPRPRAILAVSAHWYIGATAVTAMARPRTEEGGSQAVMRGYSLGSLSMTSYSVGSGLNLPRDAEGVADLPGDVPPDQTNT